MPRSSTTFRPGHKINPSGRSRPELLAKRSVSEALRALTTPEEIGQTLLAISAGIDPHVARRAALGKRAAAVLEPEPPDWTTRMQAFKMYLEYSLGKPLQGVVIQAEIDQRLAVEGVPVDALNVGAMAPEVRAALRLVASAALGQPLPAAPAATPPRAPAAVIDIAEDPASELKASGAGEYVSLDDLLALDEDGEPLPVAQPESPEIRLDFVDSTNLVSASLSADGICTVVFRGADGTAARTYRYRHVTPTMMRAWREAPSAGAWFAREIRQRHQQYPVVQGAPAAVTQPADPGAGRGGMVL